MRGRVSYVTLMVLNPIIILFYQNCSVIPASASRAQAGPPAVEFTRGPASLGAPIVASSSPAAFAISCDQRLAPCPENLE
jgi:hypothetical protein